MAALAKHGIIFKTGPFSLSKNIRCYATKAEKRRDYDKKMPPKLEFKAQSLAAKGFLRPQKEYFPPEDIDTKLTSIFQKCLGTTDPNKMISANVKYELLNDCYRTFNHSVPNSILHKIQTLEQLKLFYMTPVDVRTPYDKLKTMDLPKNLHVQHDYVRFHPDTDTKFNGVTAFPKSSTLVTGLKYKDKYKGHKQSNIWSDI